jgi:hypothetical protein
MLQDRHSDSHLDSPMNLDKLRDLRTEPIVTYKDVYQAYALSKNYCYVPMSRMIIKRTLTRDGWTCGELLSDIVTDPKNKTEKRENVGLLIMTEVEDEDVGTTLVVACFACSPWYNLEVVVHWADYRISKARKNNLEILETVWYADEFNDELLVHLKELEFKATGYLDTNLKIDKDVEVYRKVIFRK